MFAPAVAAAVLVAAGRGWWDRWPWKSVQFGAYLAALTWALALAWVDGFTGLTRALGPATDHRRLVEAVGDDPLGYLRAYPDAAPVLPPAGRGHPPGPDLLLWGLDRIGVTDRVATGLLLAAIGAAAVPLILAAVRGVCGEVAARRFLPVLVLAPYAIWLAVSLDAVVATLGAAMVAAGVHASDHRRSGIRAGLWAGLTGALLGTAALLSYAVPWLGLSVVCLYFARRRAALNLFTGLGVLLPIVAARLLGFGWVDGLTAGYRDFTEHIGAHRSVWWWAGLSLVVLLLATGPVLVASLRKVRNTPGWPFLVGAGAAVAFSVLAGFARGGAEHAWLPFFGWLTVAAVAPARAAGPIEPSPLLLVGAGAVTAVAIQAVLVSSW